MRTPHGARRLSPAQRNALAAALGILFGSAVAEAATNPVPVIINVPGTGAAPLQLSQAITSENNKFAQGAGDCSNDTIVIAPQSTGFVVAESQPLPFISCPGLTIAGQGAFPRGSLISGANSFTYGGCGLEADVPVSVTNLEISGFTYGGGLCGQYNSITSNHIHDNADGIDLWVGTRTLIGGSAAGANHIYGNATNGAGIGVLVEYGGAADITNNFFGTPDGKAVVPNGTGILIPQAANVTIDSNVMAENSVNILFEGSGSITNNKIGVDASGTGNLGAGTNGIAVSTLDPTVTVSGNTIANMQYGIELNSMSGGQAANNNIGATATGAPLANSGIQTFGIIIGCSSGVQLTGNTIGGQQLGGAGIVLAGASSSTIDSNHIGVAADGSTSLNNVGDAILVSTSQCLLGVTASKHAVAGSPIARLPAAGSGNTFSNNNLSYNGGYGIGVGASSLSSSNLIIGNTISNNGGSGVGILDSSSLDNAIVGNTVFGNTPKNIELTAGANEGIASPQIQSVVQSGGTTVVTYQVSAPAGTTQDYTIEFFTNPTAAQPAGTTFQRQVYLAGVQGVMTFSETFAGALDNFSLTSTLSTAPGAWVETSEFSPVGVATVLAPAVTFSPVSTDFGGVYVNQQSTVHTITVINGTASPVPVSTPSVTGPFIIASTDCPATLPPNSSCSVQALFAPSHSGLATGVLSLGTFTSALTGNALDAPILDITGLLDFGTVIAGTPSLVRTATLTNTGTAAVTFDSITVSGPFTMSNDCPIELLPGVSCTITVRFSSSDLGTAAGVVTINSNALGGARTIALGALVQARPEPVIEVHPDSLTFGKGLIGSQAPSMRVMISNSGGAAAVLGNMKTTLDYVVVATTCTASLAPQSSCTTDVAFRPIGFGARPGTLGFTSNASGSPHEVGLGGTGCRTPGLGSNRGGPSDPCAP